MRHPHRRARRLLVAALGASCLAAVALVTVASGRGTQAAATATPIQHLVVIFQENVSFDHYFATYPNTANTDGSRFTARPNTPTVNGLSTSLLDPSNPNSTQPFRLSHDQAVTCDQGHGYTDEQKAFDHGLMDRFPETTGRSSSSCPDYGHGTGLVMGYYDGNTVTALWNYAQSFAMSDNSYDTTFGPSTPGALNLVSGQTHGFATTSPAVTAAGTVIGDPQPTGDKCDTRDNTTATDSADRSVGDLLSSKGITWGWFQGGFRETSGLDKNGNPTTNTCLIGHKSVGGVFSADYIPHHEPFQYFASTANPQHLPPTSVAAVGKTDQANHQYDLGDFWAAVDRHNMPAVSFLKAAAYQDGHAGYSDPLDEQQFIVDTINRLEKTDAWRSTAVVVAYDDSDGWYDHQMSPIVNQSQDPLNDALRGTDCGTSSAATAGGFQDRCGYGPRQPLLVISPWAKTNFVDHGATDLSSILRFVEDNWSLGRIGNASFDAKAGSLGNLFSFGHDDHTEKLFLDPKTGQRSS
ncbi:MAG: phospholipase C [Gaiellaceae bacterium]